MTIVNGSQYTPYMFVGFFLLYLILYMADCVQTNLYDIFYCIRIWVLCIFYGANTQCQRKKFFFFFFFVVVDFFSFFLFSASVFFVTVFLSLNTFYFIILKKNFSYFSALNCYSRIPIFTIFF